MGWKFEDSERASRLLGEEAACAVVRRAVSVVLTQIQPIKVLRDLLLGRSGVLLRGQLLQEIADTVSVRRLRSDGGCGSRGGGGKGGGKGGGITRRGYKRRRSHA